MAGLVAQRQQQRVRFGPFEGGLNLRDSFTEIQPNELALGTNLTLDERGIATKRNFSPTSASFPAPPGTPLAFYYSETLKLGLTQVGSTLYKCALGGGSWISVGSLTQSWPITDWADFAGKACWTQPDSTGVSGMGVSTYDGTTLGLAVNGTNKNVRTLAVWQNKLWTGGAHDHVSRLEWSAPGVTNSWPTDNFVDLREKDDKAITALYPSSGLVVFKEDSTYRVNDATTGSYQTIDWQAGAVAPLAVTGTDGRIYFWGLDGIFASDGIGPAKNIGDKVRPLFSSTAVNATTRKLISAASSEGRVYFAFPRTSLTVCDEILELNPRVGWIMEHDLGGSAIVQFAPYLDATGKRVVSFMLGAATRDLLTSTTRTSFNFALQTGWVEPFGGMLGRLQEIDLNLNPAAAAYPLTLNYISESGTSTGGPTWTTTPTLASGFQAQVFRPKVLGRAFQLAISDSGSGGFGLFSADLKAALQANR